MIEDSGKELRSIPACAGEPYRSQPPSVAAPVYPRVCGGTQMASQWGAKADGLSPRVRGNPKPRQGHAAYAGSIPACAGEPV